MSQEQITVPDIGGAEDVDIIELTVKVGDTVAVEDPLMTLEGDKATMDIPAPVAGTVTAIQVAVGDKVSEGSAILTIETSASAGTTAAPAQAASTAAPSAPAAVVAPSSSSQYQGVHAGPSVRRVARNYGVGLDDLVGTANKGRIVKADMQNYVRGVLKGADAGGSSNGLTVSTAPKVNFSKFGEVATQPLSKIQKMSGANLHRNWVSIPHVTQFDEADITDMEAFRQANKKAAAEKGVKLTPLVFIMKAVVSALQEYPEFNSSLDADGKSLILKKYFHIGVAVDTPKGLVVPVIRDVDQKSLSELALELGAMSTKARDVGLGLKDMQGGCFTISSLGGIGGTAFTPIINAPEVAILGVSRSFQKPVLQKDGSFAAQLTLPLSLSYDHRVIDGASAARFIVYLSKALGQAPDAL